MSSVSVSRPDTADQLLEEVRQAATAETALAIAGAGSKMKMGRPVKMVRTIDLSALSGVKLYEPEELVITVAAGTSLADVERLVAEHDQHLAFEPPDFGPILGERRALGTVGGVIACNLSGPRRIKAGAARDHVLGFQAISGRGERFKSGGRVVKNVTGYDLSKLMAGSWGTLGVMTEVTLKVLPVGESTSTVAVIGLGDAAAVKLLTAALQSTNDVSGAAHLPGLVARRSGVLSIAESVTAVRVEGPGPSVDHRVADLTYMAREHCRSGGGQVIEPLDAKMSASFWAEIRDVTYFTVSEKPLWRLSVPPTEGSRVAATLVDTLVNVEHYFDWGGGQIWLSVEPSPDAGAAIVRAALGKAGGHATLVRAPEETRARVPVFQPLDPVLAQLNQRIKASFDPLGILNPGRMYSGM
jgi:glycolate oxidase FAD binding subunit